MHVRVDEDGRITCVGQGREPEPGSRILDARGKLVVPGFVDLLCGRIPAVVVRVQRREIPRELLGMESAGERARLVKQARWLEQIWVEKDAWIEARLNEEVSR